MQAEAFGWSWVEWIIALLAAGAPGLPPGPRDPQLVQVIPAESLVAIEWAGRSADRLPAPGLAAFAAEPEIRGASAAALRWWSQRVTPLAEQPGPSWSAVRDQLPQILATAGHLPGCYFMLPDGTSVLILSTGDATVATAQALRNVVPGWLMYETEPLIPNAFAHYLRTERALVWTFGKDRRGEIAARLREPRDGLSKHPDYQRAWQLVPQATPAHLVWVNLYRSPNPLTASALPPMLAVTNVEAGSLVQRGVILAPIDPQRLAMPQPAREAARLIPADAHFAASTQLGVELMEQVIVAAAALRGVTVEWNPQALVAGWGLQWNEDVVPAFGSTWTIYSAGSTGGAFGLSPVLSLDVRQPRQAYVAFTQAIERLQGWANTDPQERWQVRDTVEFDRVIYTLKETRGGLGLIAPSACLTDRQLLIALNPQTLRAHLRFLARGGPTLADHPEFAPPPTAQFWCYSEPRPALEALWPFLTAALAQAAVQRPELQQVGIDGGTWPSIAAVLPYVRPFQGNLVRDAESLRWELRHPLSGIAPLAAAGALWQSTQSRTPRPGSPDTPTDLGPAVDLGTADGDASSAPMTGVVPAVATDAPAAAPVKKRPWLSGLVRGFIPDDVEAAIPAEVFRKIEEGPTPAEQAARAERAAQRKAARERKKPMIPSP